MLPAQQKFENNQYSQQIKVETSKNNLAIEISTDSAGEGTKEINCC